MTQLLEQAFKKASQLSLTEQDVFAKWILEELESDKKWNEKFAESENLLEHLAKEAIVEYKSGKTKSLDIEKL